jgi:hypothetical protein
MSQPSCQPYQPSVQLGAPRLYRLFLLLCINLPLLSECVRKYIWPSSIVFLCADSLAILGAFWASTKINMQQLSGYWILVVLYGMWGSFFALFGHTSLALLAIGFRPLLIPLMYMMVAFAFFRTPGAKQLFLSSIVFWILVIGGVACLQLALGRDNPINDLPAGVSDEYAGIGDYTANGETIEGLFRPTSVFFQTGKYGQVIFFLTLTLTAFALNAPRLRTPLLGALIFAWISVLVSGQRAAFLFLMVSLIGMILLRGKHGRVKLSKIAFSFVLVVGLGFFLSQQARDLILERFASGFTEAGQRTSETSTGGQEILSRYGLYGEGLGFFSLGSENFGGQLIYEFDTAFSAVENSWLRIIAETGLPGATLILLLLWRIVTRSRRALQSRVLGQFELWWAWVPLFGAISVGLWSLTHDVLGNYLTIVMLFISVGAFEAIVSHPVRVRQRLRYAAEPAALTAGNGVMGHSLRGRNY